MSFLKSFIKIKRAREKRYVQQRGTDRETDKETNRGTDRETDKGTNRGTEPKTTCGVLVD